MILSSGAGHDSWTDNFKMAPVDKTPIVKANGNFSLLCSLKANDLIPVHKYKSSTTGLTVVLAEVEGPVVNGYFCLGKFFDWL